MNPTHPARGSRPIRVCFFIDALASAGTESQLVATINHLDRRLVRPYLCLLREGPEEYSPLEPRDCPVIRLGIRRLLSWRAICRLARLVRFLREQRIDVLQLYFVDSSYAGVIAGKLAGVPRLVRVQNNLGWWMTPLHRALMAVVHSLVDRVVVNCQACGRAVAATWRLAARKITVLANGIDLGRFPAEGLPSPTRPIRRVGIVANLRPVKDVANFIRAAAFLRDRYPAVVFEIAGDGEMRAELEQMAAALGMTDRIHFLGTVGDVPAFLRELDVAVLTSLSEGMSNALLEYMAAARPIVATAVGGNTELIEHERTGLLVPPGDAPALAAALARLLDDPPLAERLGRQARRHVEQHYGRGHATRRFEAFLVELVRSTGGGSAWGVPPDFGGTRVQPRREVDRFALGRGTRRRAGHAGIANDPS
ncbi:MAG: glycosyltransferase [Gemmataceae bacterium]|nr:glycosyltransferase [Gemmataceae bacterium]MDW8266968.1 glycosyltransferase [Gemmataceae bacterium]